MVKPDDPRHLAVNLLPRSTCRVQVAAVIADCHGIFSWGWNGQGADGLGEHAEAAAFRRANKRRLEWATLYVAARRQKSGNVLIAKPCEECAKLIRRWGIRTVIWRDKNRQWVKEEWL